MENLFSCNPKKTWLSKRFPYNLNLRDTLSTITTSSAFLKELLGIWTEVNFEPEITLKDHFLDQQFWHNSLIKIANKTVGSLRE